MGQENRISSVPQLSFSAKAQNPLSGNPLLLQIIPYREWSLIHTSPSVAPPSTVVARRQTLSSAPSSHLSSIHHSGHVCGIGNPQSSPIFGHRTGYSISLASLSTKTPLAPTHTHKHTNQVCLPLTRKRNENLKNTLPITMIRSSYCPTIEFIYYGFLSLLLLILSLLLGLRSQTAKHTTALCIFLRRESGVLYGALCCR